MPITAAENNEQPLARSPVALQPWQVFLFGWFLLNLLQISFTELTSDEGYYWFYSTRLQWGYYDHPPMVALLVRAATWLIPGEVGVRLMNLFLLTGSVFLFFQLLPQKLRNHRFTLLLLLAAPLVNYLSFIIFPDGPLLFFSLLFLTCYKRFLVHRNFRLSVLIGASIALMLYSKYHGVLVVLFSFLAYPRIIFSRWYWCAMLIAFFLFLPHVWWQIRNDFPTLRYHLAGRADTFSVSLALQFISQQVGAMGPGFIFIPFVIRTKDLFERVLLFIIAGTFIFFLFSSFKTFVHFHWTSIAVFPLIYFSVKWYIEKNRRIWLNSLVLPFAVLILLARVFLVFDFGITKASEDYYHGREKWAHEISQLAGPRPVLFPNNLREAPLYAFYSGKTGVALYDRPEKKSQYELWHYEDSLQGKEVLVMNKYSLEGTQIFTTSMGQAFHVASMPDFQSYFNGIVITAEEINAGSADSLQFSLTITNKRNYLLRSDGAAHLVYLFLQEKEVVTSGILPVQMKDLPAGSGFQASIAIAKENLPEGEWLLYFGFRKPGLPDSYNSSAIEINALLSRQSF